MTAEQLRADTEAYIQRRWAKLPDDVKRTLGMKTLPYEVRLLWEIEYLRGLILAQ